MDTEYTLEKARMVIKQKDEQSARSILSQILGQNPQNKEAWILLAQVVAEPDQIIDCLERVQQLDPNIKGLSQRLERVRKGPLKYYHQIIDVTQGYRQWDGQARSIGQYEVNLKIKNDLVEINNLLTTIKKQQKHLQELGKIMWEDDAAFKLIPLEDDKSPTYEVEKTLYITLSQIILMIYINQALKQLEKISLDLQINAEKKMRKSKPEELTYSRVAIPDDVKLFVWQRDQGRCAKCGGQKNLEFDHIIPIAKGGSNTARNIQLLCETCNRQKSDKIV